MVDGVPAMMGIIYSLLGRGLWQDKRQANLLDGGAPFYRCYETSDGRYLSVGSLEPQFFALLLKGLNLPAELSQIQMNMKEWPKLEEQIATAIKANSLEHWTGSLPEPMPALPRCYPLRRQTPLHSTPNAATGFG